MWGRLLGFEQPISGHIPKQKGLSSLSCHQLLIACQLNSGFLPVGHNYFGDLHIRYPVYHVFTLQFTMVEKLQL